MDRRLFRYRRNAMVGGVCGGLARYLAIDVSLIRLFFVLLTLGNGIGVLVYILLWILIPPEGSRDRPGAGRVVQTGAQEIAEHTRQIGQDLRDDFASPNPQAGIWLGGGLILIGLYYLLQSLHLSWLYWLNLNFLWPLLLVLAGLVLILRMPRR